MNIFEKPILILEKPLWIQRVERNARKLANDLYVVIDIVAWVALGYACYLACGSLGLDIWGLVFALFLLAVLKLLK